MARAKVSVNYLPHTWLHKQWAEGEEVGGRPGNKMNHQSISGRKVINETGGPPCPSMPLPATQQAQTP